MTQQEINNILEELNNGKFHVECPSCYEEVNLKEAGLFYLDQSHKKNLHREIKIDELIEPLITIPFLLKAAKKNLIYFHFNHKQFDLSISPSDVISLSNIDIPKSLNNFSLMITAKRKTNYSEETWNKLYKLSLETFVEETEGKKLTGAGAGLTDND